MLVCGIDFSITCPALCFYDPQSPAPGACYYYYQTRVQRWAKQMNEFVLGCLAAPFDCHEERNYKTAHWIQSLILKYNVKRCFIESYAFRGTNAFDVGEATGATKMLLWAIGVSVFIVNIVTAKKEATGSGAAKKEGMHAAFLREGGEKVLKGLSCPIGNSPMSDVIDSYWIARTGVSKLLLSKNT